MKINIIESVENILTRNGKSLTEIYKEYGVSRYIWRHTLHADEGYNRELRKRVLKDCLDVVPELVKVINESSKEVKEALDCSS